MFCVGYAFELPKSFAMDWPTVPKVLRIHLLVLSNLPVEHVSILTSSPPLQWNIISIPLIVCLPSLHVATATFGGRLFGVAATTPHDPSA